MLDFFGAHRLCERRSCVIMDKWAANQILPPLARARRARMDLRFRSRNMQSRRGLSPVTETCDAD